MAFTRKKTDGFLLGIKEDDVAILTLQMFDRPYWVLSLNGVDCLRFEFLTSAQLECLKLGLNWEVKI